MRETDETTVCLTVTSSKGFGRGAGWTLTTRGRMLASGRTLAEARRNGSARLAELLASVEREPAFARDDDGSLIVVIPYGTDTRTYRITEDGWALTTVGGPDTPAERIANVYHWTPIPPR